ncbi:hypothetical protein H2200_003169 [Cladophialophora chaetospira]|uniref:Uncharacterized protein n=1 Tax=Cladophialophora chaetospira TaxID=386627 RepID=A0AA38XGZ7_9EURO|nr:hypothetical protein H2200_003169 [Cladophialophora chaetospira]
MARGPSISSLLVDHLGLANSDLNAARTDIRAFLERSVEIYYALDDDIAEVARLYMQSPGAAEHFSGDALKYRWSSNTGRAEIGSTVRQVMLVQQAYTIEKLHGGEGDCPGCRHHPLPSQARAQQSPTGLQQQSTPLPLQTPPAPNVLSSQQPSRPRPTYSYGAAGNQTDDRPPFSIASAAINEDDPSDPDYGIPAPPRKRTRTSAISAGTHSRRTPKQADRKQFDADTIDIRQKSIPDHPSISATNSSTGALGVGTNHRPEAAHGDNLVLANIRGKMWNFRSHEHQSEVLAAVSTWQADEMNKVLRETEASSVAYHTRALRYEEDIESLLTQNGAQSADS